MTLKLGLCETIVARALTDFVKRDCRVHITTLRCDTCALLQPIPFEAVD